MKTTILIVEDDSALREMLAFLLTQSEFDVIAAADYPQAIALLDSRQFHLVLLDWMLPGGTGIQFIKQMRSRTDTQYTPIIMLTAKQHENDRVLGLNSGADDFISKPFSNKELIARIQALVRRSYPNKDNIITVGNLNLDTASHRVTVDNKEILLGPTEYKILAFFMQRPERVFTRDQLIDFIWGNSVYIDDRTIDVHIGRLRKQLESTKQDYLIQTVRGVGYRFSEQVKK